MDKTIKESIEENVSNIHNIDDYIKPDVSKEEQVDIIVNAIAIISNQLAQAKIEGNTTLIHSSRAAMQEFISEWQSIRGVR